MNLSSKEKTLLFIISLILIAVFGFQFMIKPSWNNLQAKKAELVVAKQTKMDTDNLLLKLGTIDQEIDVQVEKTSKATEPFFKDVDKENIHKWIMDLTKKNNLEVGILNIGDVEIGQVEPYSNEEIDKSYPISDFYNNMVNATQKAPQDTNNTEQAATENTTTEEAAPAPQEAVAKDSVATTVMNTTIKGSKASVLRFVNEINTMPKHAIASVFTIDNYGVEEEKETAIQIQIFSINKEDDGVLNYPFN